MTTQSPDQSLTQSPALSKDSIPTPRTDFEELSLKSGEERIKVVFSDFARELERELASLRSKPSKEIENRIQEIAQRHWENWFNQGTSMHHAKNHFTSALTDFAAELGKDREAEREDAIKSVLLIRCAKHLTIAQQNTTEFTGAECGACIAEERDKWKALADLKDAKGEANRTENNKLRGENAQLKRELSEAQSEVARLNEACTKEFNSVCELNEQVVVGEKLSIKLLADHNRLIAENLALFASYQRQKEALKAAEHFTHPEIKRGPISDRWLIMRELVDSVLAETPDVSLWQPIKSAPKDVPIVLYENWTQELFAIGVVHSKNGYVEGYAMPSGIGVGRASHWMPLPPPPTLQPDHQK